ncbi:hypothetical protein [Clostridium baratii]|uniref:hypothetical protein n=1 Tax=Clostridium baratii TaxID=1561 RepID=UPI0030CC6E82
MQDKLRKILNHYGEEAQSKKYIEKLSELMIAIIKGDIKNIIEEIADVKVMTKQFLMFNNIDLQEYEDCGIWIDFMSSDTPDEEVEQKLELEIADILRGLVLNKRNYLIEFICGFEYYLDRYMDINNISKEEIEKEMERKINRQLERIEREKVNK